jgi:Ca-activated chloride channel family protein
MKHNVFSAFILCFFMGCVFSCQKELETKLDHKIENISDFNFVNLKAFYYDWKSRNSIELKQNEMAHDFVLKALENQETSGLKSNLGITYDLLEKKDDAEKSFQSALTDAKTNEEKFKYQFNLGVYYGAQKKVSEALTHYQAALDIVPTSIEVKHNIELLIQKQKQDQKKEKDDKDKDKKGDGNGDSKDDPNKDGNGKDKKDDPKDEQEKKSQDRKSSAKYKPRPFKGDQLSEGDVKKILGELSQQDQKIRSKFNKKDQPRKEDKNDKDW